MFPKMAIFKLEDNKIIKLKSTTFSSEKIGEVKELQNFIINSIDTIEKDLLVISSDYSLWADSKRRIDILCLDKNANLVVIELKRTEDGGHMELQAIRYAAMVSNMTFEKIENTFKEYISKSNLQIFNPKEEILKFLEWNEVIEEDFANDVRIILVSADFSKEITTTVMWLNDRNIDIKCVRIKPQKDGGNLYLDIQQIIPLPEAADYMVKLKEKSIEQRQSRKVSNRDFSKYDLIVNGRKEIALNKRQAILTTIIECVKFGIDPKELMNITGANRWLWTEKECNTKIEFEEEIKKSKKSYDSTRWFNKDNELLHYGGNTYVFSNQHGKDTHDIIEAIFVAYPYLNGKISVL